MSAIKDLAKYAKIYEDLTFFEFMKHLSYEKLSVKSENDISKNSFLKICVEKDEKSKMIFR